MRKFLILLLALNVKSSLFAQPDNKMMDSVISVNEIFIIEMYTSNDSINEIKNIVYYNKTKSRGVIIHYNNDIQSDTSLIVNGNYKLTSDKIKSRTYFDLFREVFIDTNLNKVTRNLLNPYKDNVTGVELRKCIMKFELNGLSYFGEINLLGDIFVSARLSESRYDEIERTHYVLFNELTSFRSIIKIEVKKRKKHQKEMKKYFEEVQRLNVKTQGAIY